MATVSKNHIRTLFSRAMSRMYQAEVPKYGVLLDIVAKVNAGVLSKESDLVKSLGDDNNLARITEERHGAIRLGKPEELKTMASLFAVMGMYPVGYYDLSVANMPVHSTAFRPLEKDALQVNPFRIFTSLLRVDLIKDKESVALINSVLDKRDIFTKRLRELINIDRENNGLSEEQANEFVQEALETFRWHEAANITFEEYKKLQNIHQLVADIVGFKGPHINHLTPRTLDIDAVQAMMPERDIDPKAIIEGPPCRDVPILLRQTSFKALNESVRFPVSENKFLDGKHRARFGEIEQRGVALKPAGRALYDAITEKVRSQIEPAGDGSNADAYYATLEKEFKQFPDDLEALRKQDLIYLSYRLTDSGLENLGKISETDLNVLIDKGYIAYSPITYEDFLPVSAAGIFSSNLADDKLDKLDAGNDQNNFEQSLGGAVNDPFEWYQKLEKDSIRDVLNRLKLIE